MAAISGRTLGDLVSVEEPQDMLWSLRQMMDPMEAAGNYVAEISRNQRARLQKKAVLPAGQAANIAVDSGPGSKHHTIKNDGS